MSPIDRRDFLKAGGAGLLAGAVGKHVEAAEGTGQRQEESDRRVIMTGDGLSLSPRDYADLLTQIVTTSTVETDYYSNGGAVADMEKAFAKDLGKERAVFMPTGTLANHLALRNHAKRGRRILVQELSHVYNDSGDCCQTLSALNLLPLARGKATFTVEDVEQAIADTERGRVKNSIGAVLIESPVRRATGEQFDFEEMKKIHTLAWSRGIRTHLDGARIYLQSAYTGISPAEYAYHFDTVYVSLYKYFNAPSGAILAGPASLLDEIYHERRMFGGGMPAVWPFAVVAHYYLEGFVDRMTEAVKRSEIFIMMLADTGRFDIKRIANGTNLFRLSPKGVDATAFHAALARRQVKTKAPDADGFLLQVNETWNRMEADALAGLFIEALDRE